MWVMGDLKDRLGLQHRNARKNRGKLEQAPMFHHPHARSESELSTFQQDIEMGGLTAFGSNPSSVSASPRAPLTPIHEVQSPAQDPVHSAYSHLSPAPGTGGTEPRTASASPYSFRGSYYSASAIPIYSPEPQINNQTGNPAMSSVSSDPVTPFSQPQTVYHAPSPQPSSSPAPMTTTFEMHVRQPSEDLIAQQIDHTHGGVSASSYQTAYDDLSEGHPQQPGHDPDPAWRGSTYSTYAGARAL